MIKISGYLTGQIIAELPNNRGGEFHESVIFICKHDENGAMGFVINQVLSGVSLSDLLQQIEHEKMDPPDSSFQDPPIFWGGPVEVGRGFVLHSLDYKLENTVPINDEYGITANFDIVKAIIQGKSMPYQYILLLGYMGWKAGQLEKEIVKQSWFSLPGTSDLLFEIPSQKKWDFAVRQLGASRVFLSPIHGEA